jgi:chorismate mutase/prephenate dehydratase
LSDDPVLRDHRAQLAAIDREILAALNRRIGVVRQIRQHKQAKGLDFLDPAQERRLLADLAEANPGPLPEAGLREVFGLILAWAKRAAD